MDKSRVKAIVEANLRPLMRAFGIPHWRVTVDYGPVDEDGNAADCTRKLNYNMAHIRLDPEKMLDADYVAKILAHELFHVVLAPFDLYRVYTRAGADPEDAGAHRDETVWDHAVEQAVINLQRMYQGVRALERRKATPRGKRRK